MSYFGCAYVINLPDRRDRRKAIVRELQGAGMPLSEGKVEIFPAVRPNDAQGFPNIGTRGCFMSHLGVLTRARERRLPNVLVMEDDLIISPLMNRPEIVGELESKPWGIVYLGHGESVGESAVPRLIPFYEPLMLAHFYAVNGPVIPRLVEYLEKVLTRSPGDPLGGPMHLDGALTMFRQANPDVLTLIAQPNLGTQRPSRSDITNHWYERVPVLQQVADMARQVRDLGSSRHRN